MKEAGSTTLAAWLGRFGLPGWAAEVARMLIAAVAVLVLLLLVVLFLVWLERKVSADIQSRMGPARVGGRFGVLQTVADAIKLLLKEDIIPAQSDRWLFLVAPAIVFLPAYMALVTVPFSGRLVAEDLGVGVVYVIAVLTLPTIGLMMAGWASNNKYSLLGGIRAVAQLVTYEVPFVVAILCVVIAADSLSLTKIVRAQSEHGWFILRLPLLLAFIIYLIGALSETNRLPFDLPEAESELVAGYHTEYSGLRFAMFFLGEYAMQFFVAALGVLLFLGGWSGPWLPGEFWFLIKTFALILLIMWIRWTYPRLRIDQVMHFGWKFLLPVALLDLVWTAAWELWKGGAK
jgi:NADH-quinone oxidoreductase subunit H